MWRRDPSLWSPNPDHQEKIRARLGWLTVALEMKQQVATLQDFVAEVRAAGFKHVLLLGMGGSSLAAEVFEYSFGITPGHPNFAMLDTTDPATIREYVRELSPQHTLYLVASKSGATLETLSCFEYFYGQVYAAKGDKAGASFVAITDPGAPLERLARERKFRRIFLNPPDIGGRYSALSYFGLVPAALMGMDLDRLLDRAEEMTRACEAGIPAEQNPGLWLGAILSVLYGQGRDKITFILSPRVQKFGNWAEQLLAASLGKETESAGEPVGLAPVVDEPIGAPDVYGLDRVLIYLCLEGDTSPALDQSIDALEKAGQPVIRINLRDTFDLGGEFFRWEFATAVLGSILEVNPFDEPNVAESKEVIARILSQYREGYRMPDFAPLLTEDGISLYWNQANGQHEKLAEYLREFLGQIRPHDYIALMAFLTHSPESDRVFTASRVALRARFHVATTLGYGPRFLHSTGQLHKSGPNKGIFIQVTGASSLDVDIPGEVHTFGVLREAQVQSDWQVLQDHHRRVLRLHLGEGVDIDALVQLMNAAVTSEVPPNPPSGKDGGTENSNMPAAEPAAATAAPVNLHPESAGAQAGTAADETSTTGRRTARPSTK